jgi:hypothetical protein
MKKILFKPVPIFLFILFLSRINLFAAVLEPAVSASLDKDEARIGDIVKFELKAELPENAYIAVNKEIIFENFDTVNFSVKHVSQEPNVYLITFDIAAYKTGNLRIEPVGITYINSSGSKKMFFTPESQLLINSVLTGGAQQDIKDIKPLKKLSVKPANAAGIIFLIILMCVLTYFVIKDAAQKSHKKEIIVDPQTQALNLLDGLSEFIKNGEAKIFYYKAAEILRRYISAKYVFNAMEMTSAELLKKLDGTIAISMTKRDIKQYLSIFDLARYAGFKPSENDMLNSLEKTKEFIRKL